MTRTILRAAAVVSAVAVALAVNLAHLEFPYPMLQGLSFIEWLAVAYGIIGILTLPGLALLGFWHLIVALPGFIAHRFSPEFDPAPATVPVADTDAEWADVADEMEKSK